MRSKRYHHGHLREALVTAGLEILAENGTQGLSLRGVAKRVGVSHAAPYNHFAGIQALLAAMSTAGHEQLHQTLLGVYQKCKGSPPDVLLEVAWAYLQFALADPGRFRLMFSGALENELDHPQFEEISRKNIALLEEIVVFCQRHGQLTEGNVAALAVRIWSTVHGFAYLMLENQFPLEYLQGRHLKQVLRAAIG